MKDDHLKLGAQGKGKNQGKGKGKYQGKGKRQGKGKGKTTNYYLSIDIYIFNPKYALMKDVYWKLLYFIIYSNNNCFVLLLFS